MHRIFWGTASLAWISLVASVGGGTPSMALAASIILAVHAGALVILARSERRAGSLVRAGGWPDWMASQAEKNRRKALSYMTWGALLVVASAGASGRWRAGLAAATLAYHLGAFAAEGLLIAAQGRLLREYESRGLCRAVGLILPSGPGG